MKVIPWPGHPLSGDWLFTSKIDGVLMLRDEAGNPVTKGGHRINGLPRNADSLAMAELFCGSWGETISRLQRRQPFHPGELYGLEPLDNRLAIGIQTDPSAALIQAVADMAVKRGAEGLVLHQGDRYIKVKPRQTYDVPVTDLVIKDGRLVAFVTPKGRVGTMTDQVRHDFADRRYVGLVIEVASQGLQPSGMFRNASFVRPRFDKSSGCYAPSSAVSSQP